MVLANMRVQRHPGPLDAVPPGRVRLAFSRSET